MLRVGVVGCGGIGLRHSKAYQSHANAKLICVSEIFYLTGGRNCGKLGTQGVK